MSENKPLNIGLVGYGFMGRTHSNGYKRVNDFFPDLAHRPVLKAICARNEERRTASLTDEFTLLRNPYRRQREARGNILTTS